MTVALLVIGNGRLDYLHRAVDSALQHLPELDHYLMIDDSGEPIVQRTLARLYPDFTINSHPENWGMARAVQDGFDLVLSTDASFVFWLEEDFVIQKKIPFVNALWTLEENPTVAQMMFQRQPLTEDEHATGSVAGAMHGSNRGLWTQHRHIFSLNPCLIPRNVLEYGWPRGNEAEFTDDLLADGYTFGVWTNGDRYVEHVGVTRGAKWQL